MTHGHVGWHYRAKSKAGTEADCNSRQGWQAVIEGDVGRDAQNGCGSGMRFSQHGESGADDDSVSWHPGVS